MSKTENACQWTDVLDYMSSQGVGKEKIDIIRKASTSDRPKHIDDILADLAGKVPESTIGNFSGLCRNGIPVSEHEEVMARLDAIEVSVRALSALVEKLSGGKETLKKQQPKPAKETPNKE